MIGKFKTFIWHLKQPKGSGLLFNLLKRATVYKKLEHTSQESISWCEERAVDTKAALKKLFPGNSNPFVDIEEARKDDFLFAKKRFESTPYQMGGAGNINLLYNICEAINAKYVLETGVAYGWSSLSILLSLSKFNDSLLVSTDMPYPKMGNENYVGIVVPDYLKRNWRLIQESDLSGLPKAFKLLEYLDLVHYDSDKSYVGRMNSYPLLYAKLKKGGVFVSDDIQDNTAFKHYCERIKADPVIVSFEGKFVGVFVK